MDKVKKGLQAIRLIFRHPYLLNLVLDSEDVYKEEFVRKHGLPESSRGS